MQKNITIMNSSLKNVLEQNKILKSKIAACEIENSKLIALNNELTIKGQELDKKIIELKTRLKEEVSGIEDLGFINIY